MKHNVDKMMEGLANLALGYTELKAKVEGISVARCKMANTAEDIADRLRDCTARLDVHWRCLDNISARLNDHKETINHNANDGESRLTTLEAAQQSGGLDIVDYFALGIVAGLVGLSILILLFK